ncbi:MAG: response regulator transcription factor [Chloroflexi bacterium]|nr:response regulator transcription factor [Chloroflexota bacterium]
MTKIKVFLVDDHEIVRLGLSTLINDQPDMEVVGEAGTTGEALKAIEKLRPQVVLMDIRLPGEGGIEATRKITSRFPDTKVVMVTSFAYDELVVSAVRAGAAGYVLKQVGNEELLRGIRAAARGEALLDPTVTSRLLSRMRDAERKAEDDAFRELSERGIEVLAEVARGKTNAEIGEILNLSEKTVRNYVSNILEKLQLNNRIELATYAVEHHLFEKLDRHSP